MTMSIASMILASTRPWTYWIAPLLLFAELVLIVGMALVYYRKVLVPSYQRELYEQHRAEQALSGGMATVRQLMRPGDVQQRRAA